MVKTSTAVGEFGSDEEAMEFLKKRFGDSLKIIWVKLVDDTWYFGWEENNGD